MSASLRLTAQHRGRTEELRCMPALGKMHIVVRHVCIVQEAKPGRALGVRKATAPVALLGPASMGAATAWV